MWRAVKVLFLLFSAAGLLMMENTPSGLRDNICSWEIFYPCAEWFGTAHVDGALQVFIWLLIAGLSSSLIMPIVLADYRRTIAFMDAPIAAAMPSGTNFLAPAVKRDVWLSDAMIYALRGRWGDRIDPTTIPGNELNRFFEIEKEFRQAALDGALPIWGKRVAYGLWEGVLAEDWASYDFSEFDLLKSLADPEKLIIVRVGGRFPTQEWVRVMTSKAKVEELWPV